MALSDDPQKLDQFIARIADIRGRKVRLGEMHQLYDVLNARFFGGTMPPAVRTSNPQWQRDYPGSKMVALSFSSRMSKRQGSLSGRCIKAPTLRVLRLGIRISDRVCASPQELIDTVAHEMIHLWQYVEAERSGNALMLDSRSGGHGIYFHRKMQELNQAASAVTGKPLVHVTVTADTTTVEENGAARNVHVVVAHIDQRGRKPAGGGVVGWIPFECPVDPARLGEAGRRMIANNIINDLLGRGVREQDIQWIIAGKCPEHRTSFTRLTKSGLRPPKNRTRRPGRTRFSYYSRSVLEGRLQMPQLVRTPDEDDVLSLYVRDGELAAAVASAKKPRGASTQSPSGTSLRQVPVSEIFTTSAPDTEARNSPQRKKAVRRVPQWAANGQGQMDF